MHKAVEKGKKACLTKNIDKIINPFKISNYPIMPILKYILLFHQTIVEGDAEYTVVI